MDDVLFLKCLKEQLAERAKQRLSDDKKIIDPLRHDILRAMHHFHNLEGVGAKSVAIIVIGAVFDFIASEGAGAFTPVLVDEITDYLQQRLQKVESA